VETIDLAPLAGFEPGGLAGALAAVREAAEAAAAEAGGARAAAEEGLTEGREAGAYTRLLFSST